MNFLKQNRSYLIEEVKGNISNSFRFTIKDLYKKDAHRIMERNDILDCEYCKVFLTSEKCLFCGEANEDGIKQSMVKNWRMQRECDIQQKSVEYLSGSMNYTYPSRYRKVNKDYAIRAIGLKNFEYLKNTIGDYEVIKNIKAIQTLIQSGENVRDIAFTFKQELEREKKNGKKGEESKNQILQYISRKQIIEVGVAHYVQTIKNKRPNTIMTVVYFNSNIQFPINNFKECKIIPDIKDRTLQDMLEAGRLAAEQISLQTIQEISQKLLLNMTKAEADGQTAMTPALAFCLGLAEAWKHDLNQIVIVTDGLSNIGFGQTEQENHLQESKKIFQQLAVKHAIKSNCVVNVISFQDCAIGYDVIDEVIKRTGGVPYAIGFTQEGNEKIATEETVNYLNFEMTTGFCESTKQFCFDNKLAVKASIPQIEIKYPEDLKNHLKIKEKNWVSFDLGVKSVNESMVFEFVLPEDYKIQNDLIFKITVQQQYRRNKKINFIVREEIVKIMPGGKEQANISQATVLVQEIKDKLHKKLDDDNLEDYVSIAKKLEKIEVVENIDKSIIEKFNKKKAIMENIEKNLDKLSRDKRSIESRRKQTYNARKYSDEDIFD